MGAGPPDVSDEQLLYAKILAIGMYTGLVVLLVTFALYLSGLVDPAVPIKDLPNYWTLNVDRYLEMVNGGYLHREHALRGWWWLTALEHGDYINFLGIAMLSSVTLVCFVGIVPTLVRKRDWIYVAFATTEVVILALAASGILITAGH
jgi:hypothetical protein